MSVSESVIPEVSEAVKSSDTAILLADEVRLLTEIGFLAAASPVLLPECQRLFRQLMVLRPRRAFPCIGLASAFLNQGRAEEAATVMAEGLVRQRAEWAGEPPDAESFDPSEDPAMMQVFLGLCLLAAKRTAEGQQVLGALLNSCDHPLVTRIARGLLGLPQG